MSGLPEKAPAQGPALATFERWRLRFGSCAQWLRPDYPFLYRLILDDVFLEDAFAALEGDGTVPDAFRVNEQPWAAEADAQASCLGAHEGKIQFGAAALKVVPSGLTLFHRSAIGAEAEEEMAFGPGEVGGCEAFVDRFIFRGHAPWLSYEEAGLGKGEIRVRVPAANRERHRR